MSHPFADPMLGRMLGQDNSVPSMPKKVKELKAIDVRRLSSKAGFHAAGGVPGLHLLVKPPRCSWILRTVAGGRRRDFGLGGYPEVSLSSAREDAAELKQAIREGRDPVSDRKAAQDALRTQEARRLVFTDAAIQCHRSKANEFSSSRHSQNWLRSLELYAFPQLGSLPVSDIEPSHVLRVLEPIWLGKTDTAKRVRQRIETVLSWATVGGYREGLNPARWQGNLDQLLAKPSKVSKVAHHRALPWQEVGLFMVDLRKREGMGARALEFAILTWARSGEVRNATWDEIDLQGKLWTISAERMKAGRAHRVPLSKAAMVLLKSLPRHERSDLVFPAVRGGVLSDMSLSAVTKRMEVDAVPHGFRSSGKDWARTCTAYPDEVSELALAHVNSDSTRAAYARDELLPKRSRMMEEWGRFCSRVLTQAEVRAIRG